MVVYSGPDDAFEATLQPEHAVPIEHAQQQSLPCHAQPLQQDLARLLQELQRSDVSHQIERAVAERQVERVALHQHAAIQSLRLRKHRRRVIQAGCGQALVAEPTGEVAGAATHLEDALNVCEALQRKPQRGLLQDIGSSSLRRVIPGLVASRRRIEPGRGFDHLMVPLAARRLRRLAPGRRSIQ